MPQEEDLPAAGTLEVPIDDIMFNRFQPRTQFDESALEELSESIKQRGILQPLLLRNAPPESETKYELVAGERRLRAARLAGLKIVPAIFLEAGDSDSLEVALMENIQREDLNPIEEALAYKQLIARFGYTQEQVASKVGKDRSTVSNALRLLSLPKAVLEHVSRGTLTSGHARALLSLPNEEAIAKAAKIVSDEGLSVRDAEELVRTLLAPKQKQAQIEKSVKLKDPDVLRFESALRDVLGTKVVIYTKHGNRGRIEVEFYSNDDFCRILEKLGISVE